MVRFIQSTFLFSLVIVATFLATVSSGGSHAKYYCFGEVHGRSGQYVRLSGALNADRSIASDDMKGTCEKVLSSNLAFTSAYCKGHTGKEAQISYALPACHDENMNDFEKCKEGLGQQNFKFACK